MTQEEKDLLIKDLCAKLPYNVQGVTSKGVVSPLIVKGEADWDIITSLNYRIVKYGWKPYFRPMSSMTDEERKEYKHLVAFSGNSYGAADLVDWLNKKMFVYRAINGKDMFELELALKAPEGMYK